MDELIPTVLAAWLLLVASFTFVLGRILKAAACRRLRFSLMSAMQLITCAALIAGGWTWLRHQYYWQLNAVRNVVEEQPDIKVIYIATSRDYCLRVQRISFCFAAAGHIVGDVEIPFNAGEDEIRARLGRVMKALAPFALPDGGLPH